MGYNLKYYHYCKKGILLSFKKNFQGVGGVPEWTKGADCKSAGAAFRGSNPLPPTVKISEEG